MYSEYRSVQLLVSALKEYNVKHIVLSPGGSDIPIIHSIETDNFFKCYSVVDERSAVYFGIGISQAENTPVACVCTSGTAVSNYLPGMTEAYYQNVPIIAITADKNPHFQGQIETQKIDQINLFNSVSLKSVDLPYSNDPNDDWLCERLIKEAITSAIYHSKGPVHINLPIVGSYNNYSCNSLPPIRKVLKINYESGPIVWNSYIKKIHNAKKILIIVGQNILFTEEDKKYIERFFELYNCFISVEHISNLNCKGCIYTYSITETGNATTEEYIPDLVISIGNNISSYSLKPLLRKNFKKFTHISIDASGRYRDTFKGLSDIFECSPQFFFKYFVQNAPENSSNDLAYYSLWKKLEEKIDITEFEFSPYYVAQKLSTIIPENSVLHLAILNSTRIMQFFPLNKGVKVFSNIGALGIDGCLSTFMGQQANINNQLAFCIIGDLSFFYDMNAVGIKHLNKNSRIILLNNGGGAEFHLFMDKNKIPTLNNFVCAEHTKTAKGWIESLGFDYYSAHTKKDLDDCITIFSKASEHPLFLEVFTDKEEDARISKVFFQKLAPQRTIAQTAKSLVKKVINKLS